MRASRLLRGALELMRQPAQRFTHRICAPAHAIFSIGPDRIVRPHGRDLGQDFVGWQRPIHWNRIAAFGRTNRAQRTGSSGAADHLNVRPGNDVAAAQAVTTIVNRVPFSELVETPKCIESITIR